MFLLRYQARRKLPIIDQNMNFMPNVLRLLYLLACVAVVWSRVVSGSAESQSSIR
jgi:hypothetical protein